jgi:hypothetical protein
MPPLTLVIAAQPPDALARSFDSLHALRDAIAKVMVIGHPPFSEVAQNFQKIGLPYTNLDTVAALDLTAITTPLMGYIPAGGTPPAYIPPMERHPWVMPWLVEQPLPLETARAGATTALPWLAPTPLLMQLKAGMVDGQNWAFLNLANLLEANRVPFYWGTAIASGQALPGPHELARRPLAFPKSLSSVLALVPHYHCEQWLARCLRSLLDQTRPPDGIVVIDDGSGDPPTGIVRQFPSVTLLASHDRVGPYRLVQQVIWDTAYDAYLFQDADDWSSGDRLQHLLETAAATGAELVGTQELRVVDERSEITPVCYPLDVNRALAEKPGHGLLHPSSLVTRDLVVRLGGFATGLRFGADTEFLLRAILVARVVNLADYGYFRRKRPGSLTTDPTTGLESTARQILTQRCKARARANRAAFQQGQMPDLTPLAMAPAISLHHVSGPPLRRFP